MSRGVKVRRLSLGSVVIAGVGGAVGGGLGCGEPAVVEADDAFLARSERLTAGAGVLALQTYALDGRYAFTTVRTTTDEFLRTGQRLTLVVPAWWIWHQLHPDAQLAPDEVLKGLSLKATVGFYDGAQVLEEAGVGVARWIGEGYEMVAELEAFDVPERVDAMGATLSLLDPAAGATATVGAAPELVTFPAVFGGDEPNRTIFFDNLGGARRERVVEVGAPRKGAKVLLGFTDWRADQTVDRMRLDTQIGKGRFFGRFGVYIAPIFGKVRYEVTAGVGFDQGGFGPELPAVANDASRLTGLGRTTYELRVDLPEAADRMYVYFHVKAFVQADYTGVEVVEQWYAQGEELLRAERWDNPEGAGSNYTFEVR